MVMESPGARVPNSHVIWGVEGAVVDVEYLFQGGALAQLAVNGEAIYGTRPFVTYGKNAIAVYVGSGLLADTLYAIRWPGPDGVDVSLWTRLFEGLYASWLPCEQASLAFALSMVFLFFLVAEWMDRRGIYLKV